MNNKRNRWIGRGLWMAALVLLVAGHFVPPAYGQPATKGVVWNPGAGSAPTNLSQMYFVGAVPNGTGGPVVYFTSADGTNAPTSVSFTDTTPGRSLAVGYAVGSAVVFNGLIYTFVAEYSGFVSGVGPQYEIAYWAASAGDWMSGSPGSRMTVATGIATGVLSTTSPGPTPINAAATVWNGQIYVFSTPSSAVNWNPVVYTTADGQNWSQIAQPNTPSEFSIINDAITVPTSQIPSLANLSGVSDSVILLVGSYWNSAGLADSQGWVAYYDPGTNTFYPPIALPMPSIPYSGYSLVYANAYLGTVYQSIANAAMGCGTYQWASGDTTLHVMAATLGPNTGLAHWYLYQGDWTLDMSGSCSDQIVWPGATNGLYATMAIGTQYVTGLERCPSGYLCSIFYIFSPEGFNWWCNQGLGDPVNVPCWQTNPPCFPPCYIEYYWSGFSDYWLPVPGFYENLSPSQYQAMNDQVSATMRQMWQLIGVIAGPPPFDGSAFNSGLSNQSSFDFGYNGSTSNQQQGTWSTNYSFGDTVKMGPPFLTTKIGFNANWGATTTQGRATSFTTTLNDAMGTNTQSTAEFGQLGYVYISGPVIQPSLFNAYSCYDITTQLGYSQIAMIISGNEKLFYPYSLSTPSAVDQNSTSYGAFGLMTGSMSFPLSTDIAAWNLQPQWDYAPENIDTSSYTVLAGQMNQLANPLQGGVSETQSFTKSTSAFTTNGSSTQYTESISETLALPIVAAAVAASAHSHTPEGMRDDRERVGLSNTTTMSMSEGYTTQTTSSCSIGQSLTLTYFVNEAPSIVVYPYLLQATSTAAPWVPTGYTGPLPWLLTWYADGVPAGTTTTTAAAGAAAGEALTTAKGPAFGRAPLPRKAWGTITGYAPPNGGQAVAATADAGAGAAANELLAEAKSKGMPRDDSYFVRGGKLAMQRVKSSAIPIAMTARDFNPYSEVAVTINKRKIPISPKMGNWKLAGKVWKYQSKPGVGSELVELTLNFGAKTWDLSVTRAALGWYTDPLNPTVTLVLNLNDRYLLSNRIPHSASYHWDADLSALKQEVWVSSIGVNKDYNGKGKVKLQGLLPDPLKAFGDFSVAMNGSQRDLRVTKLEDFTRKFENKRTITYNDGTAKLEANLSTGQWSCEIDSAAFPNPSPVRDKDGRTDLRLKIGGKEFFSKRISSDYYKMALKYER